MFARLHTLATTPEQSERGLEIIRSVYLPWARDSTGFRGMIRLLDEKSGKTLVLTLWADEKSLEASSAAAEDLGLRIAGASGADYRSLEDFQVTLLDLHPETAT